MVITLIHTSNVNVTYLSVIVMTVMDDPPKNFVIHDLWFI